MRSRYVRNGKNADKTKWYQELHRKNAINFANECYLMTIQRQLGLSLHSSVKHWKTTQTDSLCAETLAFIFIGTVLIDLCCGIHFVTIVTEIQLNLVLISRKVLRFAVINNTNVWMNWRLLWVNTRSTNRLHSDIEIGCHRNLYQSELTWLQLTWKLIHCAFDSCDLLFTNSLFCNVVCERMKISREVFVLGTQFKWKYMQSILIAC